MRRGGSVDRRLRPAGDESGFTLMELLVAMMVITIVLLVLMVVQTKALVTNAQTRERTQATAYANKVMEELRALPWATLSKGLNPGFASAAGGDPNIASGKLHPPKAPSINETLVTDSTQSTSAVPLSGAGGTNKTVDVDPAIPGSQFVSRAYVTAGSVSADQVLTLTVITTWTKNSSSSSDAVVVRSQAYSPDGDCGSESTQPFLGACQAITSSGAGAQGPRTTLSATTPGVAIIDGTGYSSASLLGTAVGADVTSQQITRVEASGSQAGGVVTSVDPGIASVATGQDQVTNAASDDVGASGAPPRNPADVTHIGSTTSTSWSSGGVQLLVAPSTGTSTLARASTTTSCDTGVAAGQPCALNRSTDGTGTTATMKIGGTTFTVYSDGGGGSQQALGARFLTANGTATTGCATISGAGCVAASAKQSVGTLTFGAATWGATGPSGGLVKLSSYSDSIVTERGTSQRTSAATTTRQGTLQVWNGATYQTVPIGPADSSTVTSGTATWSGSGSTVTAYAIVTVTPATSVAANPDPAACKTADCSIDAAVGTVTVSTTWTVSSGSDTVTFTSVTVVGGTHASASYKAAPSA